MYVCIYFMVFSSELKYRHAMSNCALAAAHISTGNEMLFGLQLIWTRGLSQWQQSPRTQLTEHRTKWATESWTKKQVWMMLSTGWRRLEPYWFERTKGRVPGTCYYHMYYGILWGWKGRMLRTAAHYQQETSQLDTEYYLARSSVESGAFHTMTAIALQLPPHRLGHWSLDKNPSPNDTYIYVYNI